MKTFRNGWLLATVVILGCSSAPNPGETPLRLNNAGGATQPEDLPVLKPSTSGPLTGSKEISLAPPSLSGPTTSVTPTTPTTTPEVPVPKETITTTLGTYTKRDYKRQPGEVVVFIPSDAGDYGPVLQRLVAEGVPVDQAIAGAIADARKLNPAFGKIVAEIEPLNPALQQDIARAQKEAGSARPKLVVVEVERR